MTPGENMMFKHHRNSAGAGIAIILAILVVLVGATPAGAEDSRGVLADQSTLSASQVGTTWYVSTAGNDSNSCLAPANSCATINGAIGKATDWDTLLVAQGTYTNPNFGNLPVVHISKSLTISGGWDNSFSTQIAYSEIDGQNTYQGIYVGNSSETVIANMERFSIQNGFSSDGGGIYLSGNLTLINSLVQNNVATNYAGGIYAYGNLTLINSTVRQNSATYRGGGIFHPASNNTITLNNSTLSNNTSIAGGGMYNEEGSLTLTNVTISNNSATWGGGMYSVGSIPTLTDVIFSDNTANVGGGMYNAQGSNASLTRVSFQDNYVTAGSGGPAARGGGMYNSYSTANLTDVVFLRNFAALGGGISNLQSSPVLTNVLFADNTANLEGGGILNDENSNAVLTNVTFSGNTANLGGGGGMLNVSSNPTLLNITFSNNTAAVGGGMANVASSPTVTNTILWGNGTEVYNDGDSSPAVTYSLVQGGYAGTGNIDANPLLGPLQDNDGFTQTMALLAGSPAIDAGNDMNCPETDQRGVRRPQGSHCDIGAYEAVANLTVTKTDDTNDGVCDNDCSLREAINSALDGSTVNFASYLSGQTIDLGPGLSIDKNLTIDGSSLSSNIRLDGNSTVQVLLGIQQDVSATIRNIDFMNAEYGIFAHGNLSIVNSSFLRNGIGIQAGTQLTVANSSFSENVTGIVNFWELQVENSNFTNNSLGIYNEKVYAFSSLGNATIINCDFTRNNRGGIQNRDGILKVTDSSFTNNESDYGGAIQSNGIETTIFNTLFENNHATGNGGAINGSPLTIVDSIFINNVADNSGGAIFGSGEITNSIFTGNEAGSAGGGIFVIFRTAVSNSTFSSNFATTDGGAIYHEQGTTMPDPSNVTNNTFHENSAGGKGGGIFNDSALSLLNNTFSNNNATHGGNIYNANGRYVYGANYTLSDLHLYNNILANSSSGADCYNESNTIIDAKNNLIEHNSIAPNSCGTPAIMVDPQLGPLQDNGGPTQTMALGGGSPAINEGDDVHCPSMDQRGVTRPQGPHCDIGAYEHTGPFGDTVPPVVEAVTRADANPTFALQVDFHVTFSENVTGVDVGDFILTTSGLSGAAVDAVSGSGSFYTVSVGTGSGAGIIRLDVLDDDSIVDAASNPLGGAGSGNGNFNLGEFYTVPQILTLNLNSVAANDGWILESSEKSNLGGSVNATASIFNVGDDKANRQFVGLLHFDTSSLPDNAVITSVTLRVRKQGITGTDPFTTHGGLVLDIQQPYFGTTAGLLVSDFESAPRQAAASTFDPVPVNNWYSAAVESAGYAYINSTGTIQFRLRFTLDDNNDRSGDAIMFYSGEAPAVKGTTATNRPQLIIQYYIP